MKKILCLIFTLVLCFGLVSCDMINKLTGKGDDKNDNDGANAGTNNTDTAQDPFDKFTAAIAGNNADSVVLNVTTATAEGNLNAKYEIYFSEDNSATIKYEYERFLEFDPANPDEIMTTVSGTIYRDKDGNYSETMGVNVSLVEAAISLDISSLKKKATVSESGEELTVTVAKASTATVFGAQLDSDAALKIVLDGEALSKIEITTNKSVITYSFA